MQSLYINRKPASNFHHAIRVAETINLPLTLFVSLNFGYTDCRPEDTPKAFQSMRRKFGRWITRAACSGQKPAPATYVWVIERPHHREHLDSHWLLHVPANKRADFKRKLPQWLASVTGGIIDSRAAIHVRTAPTPRSLERYMLKSMQPAWAEYFDIRHDPQGIIDGRRSGFTKNIGPTQKRRLVAVGKYAKPRPWIKGKYR
jgi:hypothetical protein